MCGGIVALAEVEQGIIGGVGHRDGCLQLVCHIVCEVVFHLVE